MRNAIWFGLVLTACNAPAPSATPAAAPVITQEGGCSSGQAWVAGTPGFCIDEQKENSAPVYYTDTGGTYGTPAIEGAYDICSNSGKSLCTRAQISAACAAGAIKADGVGIWTIDQTTASVSSSATIVSGQAGYEYASDPNDCTQFVEIEIGRSERLTDGAGADWTEEQINPTPNQDAYCCETG